MRYTSKRVVLLEIDPDKKEIVVLIDSDEKTLRLEDRVPDEEWIKGNIGKEVDLVLRDETVVQLSGT